MQSYNIDVSEPTENDLRDIVRYIASELSSPVTALNMLDIIEHAIKSLEEAPHRCPYINDKRLAVMGYYKLIAENYIIFFTIDEDNIAVNIERILYKRREWLRIL